MKFLVQRFHTFLEHESNGDARERKGTTSHLLLATKLLRYLDFSASSDFCILCMYVRLLETPLLGLL